MEVKPSDHIWATFWHNGRAVVKTRRSNGSGKLPDRIGYLIRQQMKLNEKQFDDLLACPLDRDGYIEILRQKGHITE